MNWGRKNSSKVRKIPGKFVEVVNQIWNTFHYYNSFQFSMDFELFKRFQVQVGLTEMCSYKLIAIPIANSGELHFGQGVFHCVLQSLYYNLVDMHKLTPNIQEVMAFPNWLNVKQNLQKLLSGNCAV
jgi:hypothetical protein